MCVGNYLQNCYGSAKLYKIKPVEIIMGLLKYIFVVFIFICVMHTTAFASKLSQELIDNAIQQDPALGANDVYFEVARILETDPNDVPGFMLQSGKLPEHLLEKEFHFVLLDHMCTIKKDLPLKIKDGALFLDNKVPLHEVSFGCDGYMRGECCHALLMSEDASVCIVRSLVPFPILSADPEKTCNIVLKTPDAMVFTLLSWGLEPEEPIIVTMQCEGQSSVSSLMADSDGYLEMPILPGQFQLKTGILEISYMRAGHDPINMTLLFGYAGQEAIWINPKQTSKTGKPLEKTRIEPQLDQYIPIAKSLSEGKKVNQEGVSVKAIKAPKDQDTWNFITSGFTPGQSCFFIAENIGEEEWLRIPCVVQQDGELQMIKDLRSLREVDITVSNARPGEPFYFKVLNSDGQDIAFKRVIPDPIKYSFKDEAYCELVMLDPLGTYYHLEGKGFSSQERFSTIEASHISEGKSIKKEVGMTYKAADDGSVVTMVWIGDRYVGKNGLFTYKLTRINSGETASFCTAWGLPEGHKTYSEDVYFKVLQRHLLK